MHMEAFTYKHIAQQAERMSAIEEKLDCMTQFCPQRYSKIDNSSAHNLTSCYIIIKWNSPSSVEELQQMSDWYSLDDA